MQDSSVDNYRAEPEAIRSSLQFLRSVLASEVSDEQSVALASSLWLNRARLRWLPGNLVVQGDILLECCQRFRGFIGGILHVSGSLRIGGSCGPNWLGDETELLQAYGGRVLEFLEKPSVESTCPLELLPDELKVGGDFSLVNCQQLETLPSVFEVGGSVTLVNCGISTLPEGLTVDGDLVIDGCPLKRLPDQLEVKGNLTLANLELEALPYHLKVGGNLRLIQCRKLALIPGSSSIGGSLKLVGAESLEHVSPKLKLGKQLLLKHCLLERLDLPRCSRLSIKACPRLQAVESSHALTLEQLQIDRCPSLESIPDGLMVLRSVTLANLPKLGSLPRDFESAAPIEITGTPITGLTEKQMSELSFHVQRVPIPGYVLLQPERITIAEVLQQGNAEVRRMYLEQMGVERFESQVRHLAIAKDFDAGGARQLIRFQTSIGPERHYLLCRCPSTGRAYLLQVPPRFDNCHDAAAWLAGFDDPQEYRPLIET